MTVRAATADDLAAIAAIQEASPEASQWDPASYLDYECSVAASGGRVAGFLVVRQIASDEREILNLAVDPAAAAAGSGSKAARNRVAESEKSLVSGGARVQLSCHQVI